MKKIICLMLAVFCLLALAACNQKGEKTVNESTEKRSADAASIRIMSFNLLYKDEKDVTVNGTDETADMRVSKRGPRFVEMLRGEGIDICGVQEASEAWENYFSMKLPDTEYDYLGQRTSHTGEGGFILYNFDKFELIDWEWFCLSEDPNPHNRVIAWDADHDRLCTWALFRENETGAYFIFADTHLDNNGVEAQKNGAKLILDNLAAIRADAEAEYGISCPVLLVGDMNCETYSDAYNLLAEGMTDIRHAAPEEKVDDAVASSPLPAPYYIEDESEICKNGHYIDHMFASPDVTVESFKLLHTATNLSPYGAYLSDHNAVWATVKLRNG